MNELYELSLEEQETTIHFMRDEKYATIYTTDRTSMTKFDKLCNEAPEYYQLVKVDTIKGKICGKTYKLTDKALVSFRSKKIRQELTDEQRKTIGERLAQARKNG